MQGKGDADFLGEIKKPKKEGFFKNIFSSLRLWITGRGSLDADYKKTWAASENTEERVALATRERMRQMLQVGIEQKLFT